MGGLLERSGKKDEASPQAEVGGVTFDKRIENFIGSTPVGDYVRRMEVPDKDRVKQALKAAMEIQPEKGRTAEEVQELRKPHLDVVIQIGQKYNRTADQIMQALAAVAALDLALEAERRGDTKKAQEAFDNYNSGGLKTVEDAAKLAETWGYTEFADRLRQNQQLYTAWIQGAYAVSSRSPTSEVTQLAQRDMQQRFIELSTSVQISRVSDLVDDLLSRKEEDELKEAKTAGKDDGKGRRKGKRSEERKKEKPAGVGEGKARGRIQEKQLKEDLDAIAERREFLEKNNIRKDDLPVSKEFQSLFEDALRRELRRVVPVVRGDINEKKLGGDDRLSNAFGSDTNTILVRAYRSAIERFTVNK